MIRHNGSKIPPVNRERPTFVVIAGPKGCGKTRHAEMLRLALGCESVLDNWDGSFKQLVDCTSFAARCRATGTEVNPSLMGFRQLVLTNGEHAANDVKVVRDMLDENGFGLEILLFKDIMDHIETGLKWKTIRSLPPKENYPDVIVNLTPEEAKETAFVSVSRRSQKHGSSLVLQHGLVTHIETNINRQEGVAIAKALYEHFAINLSELRLGCDHNWVRHLCPDVYQSDYFVCTKCGAAK